VNVAWGETCVVWQVAIGSLQALVELRANNNKIVVVPDSISSLQRLAVLELENNAIAILPQTMCQLPLTTLALAGNAITYPPYAIVQRGTAETLRYLKSNPPSAAVAAAGGGGAVAAPTGGVVAAAATQRAQLNVTVRKAQISSGQGFFIGGVPDSYAQVKVDSKEERTPVAKGMKGRPIWPRERSTFNFLVHPASGCFLPFSF
jgi:hypothetical protein